jgi:hypothetical protein
VCLSLGLNKPGDFTVSVGHGYPLVYIKCRDALLELQSPDMRYEKGLICNKSQGCSCALQALVGHIFTLKVLWSFWHE